MFYLLCGGLQRQPLARESISYFMQVGRKAKKKEDIFGTLWFKYWLVTLLFLVATPVVKQG